MRLVISSKYIAEFLGTLIFVLIGCSSVLITQTSDVLSVMALNSTIVALAYVVGKLSGCQINPAISISMVIAGRMKLNEAGKYIAIQILGAVTAGAILSLISSHTGYELSVNGLGVDEAYHLELSDYGLLSGFIAEAIISLILTVAILGLTSAKNMHPGFTGVAVFLILVIIDIIAIPFTGTSINPARSIGLALFIGKDTLRILLLFIMSPLLGSALGAATWRYLIERS